MAKSLTGPQATLLATLLLAPVLFGGTASAADNWAAFVEAAEKEHGAFGKKCATFLAEHRPPQDEALGTDLLLENLRLALQARDEFPWSKDLPDDIFMNDVLPYAVFDETRESWRGMFLERARPLVSDCKTIAEAAQAINGRFFKDINVHYNTGRKAPNQSPSESIAQGRATCTGLSIIYVDACRAIGIPARAAGTALWFNKSGNHTWAEVWDNGEWKYTGADEYDAKGLNRGWFGGSASKATADDWRHAIWATSWKKTGDRFPMVWDLESEAIPGVNVTDRYTAGAKAKEPKAIVFLRAFGSAGGERIVIEAELFDAEGKKIAAAKTRAGTADMNDMAEFKLTPKQRYILRLRHGDEEKQREVMADAAGNQTIEIVWDDLEDSSTALGMVDRWLRLLPEERHLSIPKIALSESEAEIVIQKIRFARAEEIRTARGEAHEKGSVKAGGKAGGKELRFESRRFGKPGENGASLWISMHGGGGAPARVNDQQWKNQIRLYEPNEGIYVAPRAPTDTWNLWHEGHIDELFDLLIENYIAIDEIDPDRVYLMGYSAGGDGVYQLAPRMADRLGAAAMMAGHPNDASPLGLRNLPFMIFMGGKDGAYDRNKVAAAWGKKLAKLQSTDPEGYDHLVTIYPDKGHWMDREDRSALPWMAKRTRDPWPKSVVWRQSGRTHDRFYWLAVDRDAAKGGQVLRAHVDGQAISIDASGADGLDHITLRLSDHLVDLDQPITVDVSGARVFEGEVKRSVAAIHKSMQERMDPRSAASALLRVSWSE